MEIRDLKERPHHRRIKDPAAAEDTNLLPKIIGGVRFQDGIEVIEVPAIHAA